jgi:hypothetical protein
MVCGFLSLLVLELHLLVIIKNPERESKGFDSRLSSRLRNHKITRLDTLPERPHPILPLIGSFVPRP